MSLRTPIDRLSFLELIDPSSLSYIDFSRKTLDKVKKSTKNLKEKAAKIKISNDEFNILKTRLSKKIDELDDNLMARLNASKTEKWFYAFSLYSIFFAGYLIGKHPSFFHIYYSILFTILMPIRLYSYWKRDFNYFLADLCYYVNTLVMLFIWVFPSSEHLYMVCFCFTYGTLAWAVITWRNSLVLHSIEKTTSSFIHLMPPVTLFVITHELDKEFKSVRFPGAASFNYNDWNLWNGILWTSSYYLIWQSLYHYFITIKRAEKIKKGKVNSFTWLRKSYSNTALGKLVNNLPEPLPVFAFTLIQYGYQLSTMLLCPFWLQSKRAASIFMTLIFVIACYNGATYYIDIFGKRLEKEVKRLQKEIAELQAEHLTNASSQNSSSSSLNDSKKDD
ncbi:glycerophosphocholine acyltransferase ASCRUDRAFT_35846 [Ascoidea rubescens DSM 1968]|uniref:Glycerophosphocholine acyltransferase 1 n=1 Tax=Ascoidea rubescens DSM 1968 TaxID=1344418 RepID=A0A1D2VFP0_9ASCO|nr:hypothetical protein ASCRUDRAFT_35846 [Ascoidea rubescens DSM 1968]ODV60333.1 hypothetical protein ASCRUDRAFT_35846 [Ascoidea rubescens DSM 1968]